MARRLPPGWLRPTCVVLSVVIPAVWIGVLAHRFDPESPGRLVTKDFVLFWWLLVPVAVGAAVHRRAGYLGALVAVGAQLVVFALGVGRVYALRAATGLEILGIIEIAAFAATAFAAAWAGARSRRWLFGPRRRPA